MSEEQDLGASCGPGSRASTEPAKSSLGPSGFDPSRGMVASAGPPYTCPCCGAEILFDLDAPTDWRRELEILVAVFGGGHLMREQETAPGQKWPQIVPGAHDAWERAKLMLNRDSDGSPKDGDAEGGSVRSTTARAAGGGIAQKDQPSSHIARKEG